MKTFLILTSVFVATFPLSAQTPAKAAPRSLETSPVITESSVSGQNCPVALNASRDPDIGMVQTAPDRSHVQGARQQGLRLYLEPSDLHGIAEADFTVHGMIGAQMIPAGTRSRRHATEDFHVSLTSGEDHRFASTVYMKRLTGIDYIELSAIRFADGTEWHRSANSACRVTPNGFKLVASSR